MGDEIPRRARVDRWCDAEKAIQAAVDAVEAMPADVRLTDAVNHLWEARQSVADYVDGVPRRVPAVVQERDTLARRVQEWQPIETPPDWKGPHSLKLYGWGPVCGYVFCNYTPHYLGHPDEAKSLWTADNWGWVAKPTHWMPLPAPPVRD